MARPKDAELGDDFSYILRMADTDMDGLKPLATALTSVKGVGNRTAVQSAEPQDSIRQAAGFPNLRDRNSRLA